MSASTVQLNCRLCVPLSYTDMATDLSGLPGRGPHGFLLGCLTFQ